MLRSLRLLATALLCVGFASSITRAEDAKWQPAGWGGGGFFWSAAYHPTKPGVIYMGGDVDGIYKSVDHGKSWSFVNNGLGSYQVYSLATDPSSPDTVYAGTVGGLYKSTDAGASWKFVERTGPKDLRITAERRKSTGNIAVDPNNSSIVFAGSPAGRIYKSTDGATTFNLVHTVSVGDDAPDALRLQIGKNNADAFGGFWIPLEMPADLKPGQAKGIAFRFRAEGALKPGTASLTVTTKDGGRYRAKSFVPMFASTDWQDLTLATEDFTVDPELTKKNPDLAKSIPAQPDWTTINRLDFVLVGNLAAQSSIVRFAPIALDMGEPPMVVLRDFAKDKSVHAYGNAKAGAASAGSVPCVAVSMHDSKLILAATDTQGMLRSEDAGQTWATTKGPDRATSVCFVAKDANLVYATFATDGVFKSTDRGQTWERCGETKPEVNMTRVVVDPKDANNIYAIGSRSWGGRFYASHDAGATWSEVTKLAADYNANPTTDGNYPATVGLSSVPDLAISPVEPNELFMAANWRPAVTHDAGKTLVESSRGADISCIHDIRFHKGKVYVSAMDEGSFVSADSGANWTQLWPRKFSKTLSGHNWRVAVIDNNGVDRILATCTPWEANQVARVIYSDDDGKTYKDSTAGLPDYRIKANTMWGDGMPRALAIDPTDPKTLYLGIDGDPTAGKSGGGIFKSTDAGATWSQLPGQPGARRMFYGLVIDPTDPKRLYWGACDKGGGVYRSEDGGQTWEHVFRNETYVFNLHITADGTLYVPGKNLWRSTDHGKTFEKLTDLKQGWSIVGLETDPTNPNTIWISQVTWGASSEGAVLKSTDAGKTWDDITSDLPYRKPLILRFNPETRELWAGGVGLFRLKQ